MQNTLTRNLIIGFGLSLLMLLASSVASYISISNLLGSITLVNHTYQVMAELDNVVSPMKDAEAGQRGFLITEDPSYLESYNGSIQLSMMALERVRNLTADNPVQLQNCDSLQRSLVSRFNRLQELIDAKRANNLINVKDLRAGKGVMDDILAQVRKMKDMEQSLLAQRTARLNKFAAFTPMMIVLVSVLAIIVAIFFYVRVRSDIYEKVRLQEELQKKDEQISRRLTIVGNLAQKIAAGDYSIRIEDNEKDSLGSLAIFLNKMAGSLDYSFRLLSDKEWLQEGSAGLNKNMVGEKGIGTLTKNIIEFIAGYTGSHVGAVYLLNADDQLEFISGYAFSPDAGKDHFRMGEGIIGESAVQGKEILINPIPDESLYISFATGALKPKSIVAFPIHFEGKLKAVIELGTLRDFSDLEIQFLRNASENIGIAINTAQNRARLQELLEQTQAQTEELQAQHSELENMNAEMEVQTEKLQASEEELKVQQEELLQSNRELEERTKLLEERTLLITERNLEIQKKAEELAASTRYKSEFLANMSHELRTPLNSILLLSKLMAENSQKNLSQEQVEYAQVIRSSGNNLLELIDEILDLSKIEAGKMQLEYSMVQVEQIRNDLSLLFEPLAKQKNLEFRIIVDPDAPHSIETDKLRLEQVLKNLLSNAFKFTKEGHVHLKITSTGQNNALVSFTVSDSGIGIATDKQEIIFEAFQQADGSTRRKYGGTGLGLSISRELTKLLNGKISVRSLEGKGSSFTIEVPVTRNATAPELQDADKPHPAEKTNDKPAEAMVSGPAFTVSHIPGDLLDDRASVAAGDKVILIVEDDTNFAKALLEFTRKKGYKGIVAVRGDVGIELAHSYHPTGILLDIQLPVKNGWEVMDELKSDPKTRHIPVHVMSSFEVKKESLRKGAVDFINKPVAFEQMDDIFRKIEYVLQGDTKKVLIIEENSKHARALSYFLSTYDVHSEISHTIGDSIKALQQDEINCVILDIDLPDPQAHETLEVVKQTKGLENLPIIIFTGKSISRTEEQRIRQYADSIVLKTAHSYQRILDEVSLFLHLVDEKVHPRKSNVLERLGVADEVLKNKVVLVADDDVRNIYSLTKALEKHKMKVLTAIDGKEALAVLKANPSADIILMDMMMPELDGYETIRKIRNNGQTSRVPIIAITAKAMSGDREKCIRAGASDYISKPVDIDQLISLLRIWLYEKA